MHTTIAILLVLSQASAQVDVVVHVPDFLRIRIQLTSVATDSMLVSPDPLDLAMYDTGSDSIVRTLCVPILKRIGHLP
jgi:hypothetical protein